MAKKRSTTWHDDLEKKVLSDPESRAAYEETKIQLELGEKLKTERQKLHLTQVDIAERMGTKKSAIARLESGQKYKSSPSLLTLVKYAAAVGKKLKIDLIGFKKESHR